VAAWRCHSLRSVLSAGTGPNAVTAHAGACSATCKALVALWSRWSGVGKVAPSSTDENVNESGWSSIPSIAARARQRSRCSRKTTAVSKSSAIRRCWCVFNSASTSRPSAFRIAFRSQIVSRPSSRLSDDHRIAHSSPRRAPVVIATHNNAPQSGSRQASVTIRAACSGVGGCGFGFGAGGGSAWPIGLTLTQRHRAARL
jgi:hypothetical protein